jgi:hypothetical protein
VRQHAQQVLLLFFANGEAFIKGYLVANKKHREAKERAGTTYSFQSHAPVTYFL